MTILGTNKPPNPETKKSSDSPLMERLDDWIMAHPDVPQQDVMKYFLVEVEQLPSLTTLEQAELLLMQAQMLFNVYRMQYSLAEDEAMNNPGQKFELVHGRVQGNIQGVQEEIVAAMEHLRRLSFTYPHGLRIRNIITL